MMYQNQYTETGERGKSHFPTTAGQLDDQSLQFIMAVMFVTVRASFLSH